MENKTFDYELRDLKASDIGSLCKIISKIGLESFGSCFNNDNIRQMVESAKDDEQIDYRSIGGSVVLNIANTVVSNYPEAERDIQMFVASVSGMDVVSVQTLSMADFAELIIAIIKKDEFKDFFGRVVRLFK